MKIKCVALLVTCVFIFQSCASIILGTSQEISVTSNPSGAKIIVDGKEKRNAPLILKLKRKKDHIIRIEKEGYNPLEIRITRKTTADLIIFLILGNVIWGFLGLLPGTFLAILSNMEQGEVGTILALLGFIAGWGGAIHADFKSGANYILSPNELNVTLTKIEGKPQPNLILVNAEQFHNIRWIRIKCADSDGEEIVNLD